MMKLVIDTNILVVSLSSRSIFHWVIKDLFDERFTLHVTDEIMLEYEEILTQKYSASTANNFITALKEAPNVIYHHIYYRWKLLSDPDDNKFVDCYLASGADLLISNDAHFKELDRIDFPSVHHLTIDQWLHLDKR